MKTITDFRNELLKRKEIKFLVKAESNPGFTNALKLVVENFKAKEDSIAIKTLKSKFGRNTFLIDAYIYDSTEDKARIEPKPKVKKSAQVTEVKK